MADKPTLGIPAYNNKGHFLGYECPHCFKRGEYSNRWDRYACVQCRIWLDAPCSCTSGSCPYTDPPDEPEFMDSLMGEILL